MTLSQRLDRLGRAISRRGKDEKKSRARAHHFDKIADEEHKKWAAAKKDGRDRNAAAAKAKAQRATRKAAWWDEQADEAEAGVEEMQKRRAKVKHAQAVRRRQRSPATGFQTPVRPWNTLRRPVCGWFIPILDEAYRRGWRGYLTSGVRTPAYSISLCYGICHQASCPGTCAGASSNHNATSCIKPQGAVDATDYYTLASVLRQMGNPIFNDLPIDRVHFSATGH